MLIDFNLCSNLIYLTYGESVKKIYHIGAHIGEEASLYALNGVTDVVWFEANKDLVDRLKLNVSRFNMTQHILPCALWDENTVLNFNVTNNFQSSSFFDLGKHSDYYPNITVSKVEKVKAWRMDTLINLMPRVVPWSDYDFLNIDTQGAELPILKGFGNLINAKSLKGIYLEVNRESLYNNIALINEIDDFLRVNGFLRVLTKWTAEGWGDAFYLKTRVL